MPNAKDTRPEDLGHNIMLLGYSGSGKTSQILTLPGKTFCYLFDPSALHTLAGHDIDYEMFVPTRLNISAQSLKKGRSDIPVKKVDAHEVYTRFAADFTDKVESGFFNDYDTVVLDSFTTFSDAVMDRVMHLNGRLGQQPGQDDWAAQMQTIKSVFRELSSLTCSVVGIGHVEFKQEEESGKMMNVIILTGQLRTRIPLLFSDILYCDVDINPKGDNDYLIQTMKDRYNPQVRCTLRTREGKKLARHIPAAIPDEDWADPRGKHGLGRLILEHSQAEIAK